MKKRSLAFLLFLALCGCSTNKDLPTKKEKPIILVSVAPYIELIQQIAGDSVDVRCAVPPGIDPHNWEPTYKDMDYLQGAVAWFTIGEEFEPRLSTKLYETSPDLVIYNLQGEVPTLPSNCGNSCHKHESNQIHWADSHFWLDPILDIYQARFIEKILSSLSPDLILMYKENLKKLENDLLQLNESTEKKITDAHGSGKYLVTTHGAYTYYCGRYNLYQIIIEPSGGKEPRTQEITKITEQIQKKSAAIVGVFLQPQHSNKAALIIAQKLNLPTYTIDPYKQNYMETIRLLTAAVVAHPRTEKATSFNELDEKEEAARDLFYSTPESSYDD
jgi:zinc transport system substrate-binding protein